MIEALAKRVQSKTRYLDWYRHFACKANGMPVEPDEPPSVNVHVTHANAQGESTEGTPQTQAPAGNAAASPASATEQPAPASGLSGWVKPAVLVGASLLSGTGLAGIGITLLDYFRGDDQTPVVIPQEPRAGSLLQHLEDRGYHLPSGE